MTRTALGLCTLRAAFWSTLAFTFVSAVIPASHTLRLVPWDKAEHFIAFYVLTTLAVAGFPRARLAWVAIGLSCFGAAIEVVQGLRFVARDRDFWDWVADTTAIAAVIGPLLLSAWRLRWRERHSREAGSP